MTHATHWMTSLLTATYPFVLPALGYEYESLEPHIDAATMKIHHQKHHQAYINNLNAGLEKHPEFQTKTLEWLTKNFQSLPTDLAPIVRNHGGGHFNHSLFWNLLSPTMQWPSETFTAKIEAAFESTENFKTVFNKAALSVFGSGWAWLCIDKENQLIVTATANQDTPLSSNLFPILGLDVWEHAYYLKYQNQRASYIEAFWNIINWNHVEGLVALHQTTRNN